MALYENQVKPLDTKTTVIPACFKPESITDMAFFKIFTTLLMDSR